MALTITGDAARLERGYLTAARIGAYTVTRDALAWSLVGAVVEADAYQIRQRPLIFVAPFQTHDGQRGEWRWPVLEVTVKGGRVSATLGAPAT